MRRTPQQRRGTKDRDLEGRLGFPYSMTRKKQGLGL